MGQPNPPGDNVPLIEGLGPEWNDVVSAFPEDKRAELGGILKNRVSQYEPLQEYAEFQKAGVGAQDLTNAMNLFQIIERNPRDVYDTIGKHLGLTPAETKEAVKEIKQVSQDNKGTVEDPRIATLEDQVKTLAAIALAKRNEETQAQTQAQADTEIANELGALKSAVGDFDEEEVLMRMWAKGITAQEAYTEYTGKLGIARRPAPFVMGQGGMVPAKQVDVRKLDTKETKDLVSQMLMHARDEAAK